jgi:hypothetical protein
MRRAWAVIGIAALGAQAWGQDVTNNLVVALTFDRTSIGIGETARASITASWVGLSGSYFSTINVDLIASGAFVAVSDVAPVPWNNLALGFNGQGTASGADVVGLEASQFSLIPPYTPDNPIFITTFVVTGIAEGSLSYHSVNALYAPFPYSVTSPFVGGPVAPPFTNDVFESQALVVTPGPGAVTVLGVVGLGGLGRRRR